MPPKAPAKKDKKDDAPESAAPPAGDHTVPSAPAQAPAGVPLKRGADADSQIGALLASDTIKGLSKARGARSLIRGAEIAAQKQYRIQSGIFPLDLALEGGWSVGGVHMLIGHKSSFKTTAIFKTFGNAQKMCANCWVLVDPTRTLYPKGYCECGDYREPVCAYIDVEGALDVAWASRFMDLNKILVSSPEYAEQALTIAEALLLSKKVDLLAIDSLAFLTPAAEIEKEIEKLSPGEQARIVGKAIRKFVAAMNKGYNEGSRTTVFATNQIRMRIGVMFGNPETTSAGLAPGFWARSEVKMRHGKYNMNEDTGRPIFADFPFKVEKNKSGVSHVDAEFRVALTEVDGRRLGDVLDEDWIVSEAQKFGLLTGGGGGWECAGEKFRKKEEVVERLKKDPAYRRKLTSLLLWVVKPK